MTADQYPDAIRREARRITEIAGGGALDNPVAHLDPWTVRDVVAHLGAVHRWAAHIVTTGGWEQPSYRNGELQGDALVAWFAEGAEALAAALDQTPDNQPCWNFSPGSTQQASFWRRRQAHETSVHRWDIEAALGDQTPVETEFAADGVDEVLQVFVRIRGKIDVAGSVGLWCDDAARGWRLSPGARAGRVAVEPLRESREGACDADVRGRAADLLLLVWGRRDLHDPGVSVRGDQVVAARLLASKLTP